MFGKKLFVLSMLCLLNSNHSIAAEPLNAASIVRAAINHWRGVSSYTEMTMIIHRPDWERSMSMRAWTKGEDETLVRITAPRKDRGNGTLTIDNSMWSYSPKVNRVIKVPSSMMNQSWMGSDFSNKDISRSDDIIDQYDHKLLKISQHDGHQIYEIESIPLEGAAVVWGREVMVIRDDYVMISHVFYDQDQVLVKSLSTLEFGEMSGRDIAIKQRMNKPDTPDEWTEVLVDQVEYDVELNDRVFTQSNLRNPRN